jgi:hypothetical protein
MQLIESLLCELCARTRDDPLFRVPRHLVHPMTAEPMLFDTHSIAQCPTCETRWRRDRRNKYAIVT